MGNAVRYSACVVGGGLGGKLSMDALVASPRYRLVAAADLKEDVRQVLIDRCPGIRVFANHQEMFAECPTDVVCVSTYASSHREVALDALDLDLKGILCEKPLADTAAAGRVILEAVKAKALPMVVPHGLLKSWYGEEVLARVRGGEIGELELVEIEWDRGDILSGGVHWLSYFVNLVSGDPMDWVMAVAECSTQVYEEGTERETTSITYIQTVSGVRAVMHTGYGVVVRHPGAQGIFRLVGTRGRIEFWPWRGPYQMMNATYPEAQLFETKGSSVSGHRRYLEELAEQIDREKPDYVIPESSLTALELARGAYLSSAHRCKVSLPLSDFVIPPEPDWRPGHPYRGHGGRDGSVL